MRKFLSILVCFLCFITAACDDSDNTKLFGAGGDEGPMVEDPIRAAAGGLTGSAASIHTTTIRIFQEHSLTAKDIYKLDFSLPGDPTYGDNPEFEVFNPDANNHPGLPPEFIARFTDDPDPAGFVFTIANKIYGAGTDETDLIAVFPNVKPEICEDIRKISNLGRISEYTDSEQQINLTAFPDIPAVPPTIILPFKYENTANGCIRTKGGLYYVHTLYLR